ncbi:hypothetical protein M433DRAFT_536563 [Acidomyces richmondensis BFW]|nr:MAG: hypothetical protein FE78DRAFT_476608 [Acidomyces sp. 'richmondensis']KYG40268.1 hypothetical protein M433DRAFT_536563 [Acidomyces richmondensis BFW]
MKNQQTNQQEFTELDRYLTDNLYTNGYEDQPLRWRQEMLLRPYLTLAKLTFDLFSIPSMSSEN